MHCTILVTGPCTLLVRAASPHKIVDGTGVQPQEIRNALCGVALAVQVECHAAKFYGRFPCHGDDFLNQTGS
jgi:hypothetical protein